MALTKAEERTFKAPPPSEQQAKDFDTMLTLDEKNQTGNGSLPNPQETKEVLDKPTPEEQQGPEKEGQEERKEQEQEQEQEQGQKQQEEVKQEVKSEPAPDVSKILGDKLDRLVDVLTPKPPVKETPKAPEFKLYEATDDDVEGVLEGGEKGKAALTRIIRTAIAQGVRLNMELNAMSMAPLQVAHQRQQRADAESAYITKYPEHKNFVDLGHQVADRMLANDSSWANKSRDEFFSAVHDNIEQLVKLVKSNGSEQFSGVSGSGKTEGAVNPPKIGGGGARGSNGSSGGKRLSAEQELMKDLQDFVPRQGRS